jgi:hypothetical protein
VAAAHGGCLLTRLHSKHSPAGPVSRQARAPHQVEQLFVVARQRGRVLEPGRVGDLHGGTAIGRDRIAQLGDRDGFVPMIEAKEDTALTKE